MIVFIIFSTMMSMCLPFFHLFYVNSVKLPPYSLTDFFQLWSAIIASDVDLVYNSFLFCCFNLEALLAHISLPWFVILSFMTLLEALFRKTAS